MTNTEAVQIAWNDADQTCVRLTLHKMSSYRVVSDAFAAMKAFVQSVSHSVDVMIVVESNDIPVGFIHAVREAEVRVPPNINRMILVSGRQLTFQMIHQFMSQYRPNERLHQRFYFFDTEAEARALLAPNQQTDPHHSEPEG
jgi:hypothetical protein